MSAPEWLSCGHEYTPTAGMPPWKRRGFMAYYCPPCARYVTRMRADKVRALKSS